jgi:hypothetical protein
MAMCELDEYFSCLGGAARPTNMAESEILLYIGCKLLELNNVPVDETEFANQTFIDAAKPVLKKANAYLSEVTLMKSEIFPFILDFYEHYDAKLKAIGKTDRWESFGDHLRN